jgi:hypothetical protein
MATKEPCELVVIPELNLSAVGKRWKAVETLLLCQGFQMLSGFQARKPLQGQS